MTSIIWPSFAAAFVLAQPIIKNAEGFEARPYMCPAGKATIGWGTTRYPDGRPVTMQDAAVSQVFAQTFLEAAAKRVLAQLQMPGLIARSPTVHQAGAFLSLAYNIGVGAHDGVKGDIADSDLLDFFNHGDLLRCSHEFIKWNKAHVRGVLTILPGLTVRRLAERNLFLTPDSEAIA